MSHLVNIAIDHANKGVVGNPHGIQVALNGLEERFQAVIVNQADDTKDIINARVELAEETVKAWADKKISQEEADRISGLLDTLNKAKGYADGISSDSHDYSDNLIGQLELRLGALSWEDKVEIARLGETIIQGGYLKTELIEANSIGASQIRTNELVVGGNIKMGPNAVIEWGNLSPDVKEQMDIGKMRWLGDRDSFPDPPKLNEAFYHTGNSTSYIYDGTTWQVIAQDGTIGPQGPQGNTGPAGEPGISGPPGKDGSPVFTWVKYSANANGSSMSDYPDGMYYIGLAYNKPSPIESTVASDYTWSLIRGEQGNQGVEGPKGSDGESLFTWIKYADTPTSGMSDSPTGKFYMGIAYNKKSQVESTIYSDYFWSLIKGADGAQGPEGPRGFTGAKGENGTPGIQGPTGPAGQTLYTWIKYADTPTSGMSDSPEGKKYMGIAHNRTFELESNIYTDYDWTLIKGEKGDTGVVGPKGADGTDRFTWIKYADTRTGGGISDSPDGKTYIGLAYNKTTSAESINPLDYSWSLIQGGKGDAGPQGPQGADGLSSYTHIAYADNPSGTGFSKSPTGKAYVGMYVDNSPTDSPYASYYKWSLIKGADGNQGIQGPKGADGQTPYFHTAWANNSTGTSGFSTTVSADKSYIGTYTDYSSYDSTLPSKYNWVLIKGETGPQGAIGPQGYTGPQGPQGPQGATGTPGSYYAPGYLNSTYIGKTEIHSPTLLGETIIGSTGQVGMTATGTSTTDVRFWAGSSFASRASAPFRVLQDGTVTMTKANIETSPLDNKYIKMSGSLIEGGRIAYGSSYKLGTASGTSNYRGGVLQLDGYSSETSTVNSRRMQITNNSVLVSGSNMILSGISGSPGTVVVASSPVSTYYTKSYGKTFVVQGDSLFAGDIKADSIETNAITLIEGVLIKDVSTGRNVPIYIQNGYMYVDFKPVAFM